MVWKEIGGLGARPGGSVSVLKSAGTQLTGWIYCAYEGWIAHCRSFLGRTSPRAQQARGIDPDRSSVAAGLVGDRGSGWQRQSLKVNDTSVSCPKAANYCKVIRPQLCLHESNMLQAATCLQGCKALATVLNEKTNPHPALCLTSNLPVQSPHRAGLFCLQPMRRLALFRHG